MISRAREREIDLEHIGNRKVGPGQTVGVSAKKPMGFNSSWKDQEGRICYGKYGRSHDGVYIAGGSGATSEAGHGTLARIVLLLSPPPKHHI